MKKTVLAILALVAFCTTATAQRYSVEDVEALPGETVTFTLHMAEVKAMTSMHFELVLPDGITAGEAVPTSEWTSMFSSMDGRVSGISTTSNAFNGEGDILTMPLTVASTLPLGDYVITFSEVRLNGNSIHTDATITVHVVSAHQALLDENSTTAPTPSKGLVNVTVRRTINGGEWGTLCLPFGMTAAQVKQAFGDEVQLADFKGYDARYNDKDEPVAIAVNFSKATAIVANRPCLIKPQQTISEFTVEGVEIRPVANPSVEYDNGKTGKNRIVLSEFTGIYTAGFDIAALIDEGYQPLFLSGGQLWYASSKTRPMKGFRAYFDFADVLPEATSGASSGSRMQLVFGDVDNEDVTAIRPATAQGEDGAQTLYDLQGRRISEDRVQRGLYIKNGKKIIVK